MSNLLNPVLRPDHEVVGHYDRFVVLNDMNEHYCFVDRCADPAGVAILAIDVEDRVALVVEDRLPVNRKMLEIPRGGRRKGETSVQAAVRELQEETGIEATAEQMIPLGTLHPDDAILAYGVDLFAFRSETRFEKLTDSSGETEEQVILPLEKLNEKILKGEVTDSFTLAILYRYNLWLVAQEGPPVMLTILDEKNRTVAHFRTCTPEQSMQDFCRNRDCTGWHFATTPILHED